MSGRSARSALLLAAGLGTRLDPLTRVRAKAAVPVAGVPMARRIARWLSAHGIENLVVNLHHRPSTITRILGDGEDLGLRIRYSWEPQILGSAGGPRQALTLLEDQTFLIVNGDTLTDVDLAALSRAHRESDALVTLALIPNHDPDRYGGAILDAESRITHFVPRGPSAHGSFHVAGVQAADARAFAGIEAGTVAASIGGIYNDLIAKRPGAIAGFVTRASFRDIGTVRDYWQTSTALIAQEQAPWTGRNVRIDPHARVTRSILWDDVTAGADCVLDECIVTDGVRVPPGTYRRTILYADETGRIATVPFPE